MRYWASARVSRCATFSPFVSSTARRAALGRAGRRGVGLVLELRVDHVPEVVVQGVRIVVVVSSSLAPSCQPGSMSPPLQRAANLSHANSSASSGSLAGRLVDGGEGRLVVARVIERVDLLADDRRLALLGLLREPLLGQLAGVPRRRP